MWDCVCTSRRQQSGPQRNAPLNATQTLRLFKVLSTLVCSSVQTGLQPGQREEAKWQEEAE